jgi:hypothetical protein
MGLKKQFLAKIKEAYPEFNPETSEVEIEFCGGGDNFDSFTYITVSDYKDGKWRELEGNFDANTNENTDFLFEIVDAIGVGYDFNNAGTTGRIRYEDGELSCETIVSSEYWGELEEDEDDEEETK